MNALSSFIICILIQLQLANKTVRGSFTSNSYENLNQILLIQFYCINILLFIIKQFHNLFSFKHTIWNYFVMVNALIINPCRIQHLHGLCVATICRFLFSTFLINFYAAWRLFELLWNSFLPKHRRV